MLSVTDNSPGRAVILKHVAASSANSEANRASLSRLTI
jgi:hypothetical protein